MPFSFEDTSDFTKGEEEGYKKGYAEGLERGYAEGLERGYKSCLLDVSSLLRLIWQKESNLEPLFKLVQSILPKVR